MTRTAPIAVTVKAPAPKPTPAERMATTSRFVAATRTIVQPGLYPGIPFCAYQRIDGVNQSALKDARTPAHIKHELDGADPRKETKAMILGRALHYRLLEMVTGEPSRLVGGPINPNTGKPYGPDSDAYKAFVKANPDKIVMGTDMPELLDGMAEAVMADEDARKLVEAKGDSEASMVWDEPVKLPDGDTVLVRCKGRLDKVVPGVLSFDLKTIDDASDEAWSLAIFRYGYHFQEDFYRRGREACGIGGTPFGFLVVENNGYHGVRVLGIGDESRAIAKRNVDRALAMVAACQRAGAWPGYDRGVKYIEIPTWALIRAQEGYPA